MRMHEWIPHIVMLVLGALMGWYISHVYYMQSASDLHSYSRSSLAQSKKESHVVQTQYQNLEKQYAHLEKQYAHEADLIQSAINRRVVSARRDSEGQITVLLRPNPPMNLSVH